jgi:hypothetical protein
MSETYIAKKMVRERRENERRLLIQAKEEYYREYGSRVIFRNRLNEIKSRLRKLPEFQLKMESPRA